MRLRQTAPLLLAALLAACAAPGPTPAPQTIFTAAPQTATSTTAARPTPSPTLTMSPAAAVATRTPAAAAAPAALLAGQAVRAGEAFAPVDLDAALADSGAAAQELLWTAAADPALEVTIEAGLAQVTALDAGWSGPAQVSFRGCAPDGACLDLPLTFVRQPPEPVEVTLVNNAGFVIAAAGRKIVIDGLFWGTRQAPLVPEAEVGRMRRALPPFDDLQLILVSHDHYDHFDPQIVGENMLHNRQAVLVTTGQAAGRLAREFERYAEIQDRVVGVTLARDEGRCLVIAGLGIEVFNFPHGIGAPHNLAFLITIGGQRLLHTGDLVPEETPRVLQVYQLAGRPLELALVPYFWFTNREYQSFFLQGLDARQVVPMHYSPAPDSAVTSSAAGFEQAVLFSAPYDTLTFGQ